VIRWSIFTIFTSDETVNAVNRERLPMSFHGFMVTVHWTAVLFGGFMLAWTLMLLVLTNCGKKATHLRPLFCGGGVGSFMFFAGMQGLSQQHALPEFLTQG
jgi:hypothetical protein